jgi:hypothetical protein
MSKELEDRILNAPISELEQMFLEAKGFRNKRKLKKLMRNRRKVLRIKHGSPTVADKTSSFLGKILKAFLRV